MDEYKIIATLNEAHHVSLVQHKITGKVYVKKILDVYNLSVYQELFASPITGIPQIVDYALIDGKLHLIENYISGQSLEELIATGSLDITTILDYMDQLCGILGQLHNRRPALVHRDIKPSNIIITEHNHVMLIDFNAAKHYSENARGDTVLLGTKGYAAPEQYGFGSSSPQTDIYAMGILLKELTESIGHVPSYLQEVIAKCTELNPSDRYENVGRLRAALTHENDKMASPKKKFTFWEYLPPGFRTHTLWKMLLATPVYLLLILMFFTLGSEGLTIPELWAERFFAVCIFLAIICGTCNYLDIQKRFPLCKHRLLPLRWLGILLLDCILVFFLLGFMIVVINLI